MRIKNLILSLVLLGFSINTQAQTVSTKKATITPQEVKKAHIEAPSVANSKATSQQTKNNIRRRNMAKYKAMSQKPRRASATEKEKMVPKINQ